MLRNQGEKWFAERVNSMPVLTGWTDIMRRSGRCAITIHARGWNENNEPASDSYAEAVDLSAMDAQQRLLWAGVLRPRPLTTNPLAAGIPGSSAAHTDASAASSADFQSSERQTWNCELLH